MLLHTYSKHVHVVFENKHMLLQITRDFDLFSVAVDLKETCDELKVTRNQLGEKKAQLLAAIVTEQILSNQ